jgi:aryl-alcohol dehydrogenase-like predicted oxidoreductase
MNRRQIGNSDLSVSEISLGNWVTHGGQVGDDAARACVEAALDSDINFFDTADIYERGKAETVLGNILKDKDRDQLVVATKVYWPMSNDPKDRGLGRDHMLASIDNSLKRLQMDHVDLYQAHRYDSTVPLEETMRAFHDIVQAGKARYIGISEWTADQIADGLRIAEDQGLTRIVSSQPQYSMLWRVPEAEVMPLCAKEGISQIVWSPLAMGVLTGKYKPGEKYPQGSRAAYGWGVHDDFLKDDVLTAVQELVPIAESVGLTMAGLALAWVLQNENVAAAIIGATKPEQVTENVTASGVKLDAEVMDKIDAILGPHIESDPSKTG